MDSRLLSSFHDETNNFIKFEAETNFWSSESDDIGLQLTETLHGILPGTPEEDTSHYFINEEELSNSLYGSSTCNSNTTSQEDEHDTKVVQGLTVERCNEDIDGDNDARSCISRSTFRSRTDSSSIGDYESHSSDYDEDDYVFFGNNDDNLLPLNDIIAEDDVFDIDVDANTFDLATFIIEDDIPIVPNHHQQNIVIPQKNLSVVEAEDDSDSDVDVETVEDPKPIPIEVVMPEPDFELEEELSTKIIKEEKIADKDIKPVLPTETKKVEIKQKNLTLVPNKRQRDFLKGKFGLSKGKGLGKGKNISLHKKPSPVKKTSNDSDISPLSSQKPAKVLVASPEKENIKRKLNLSDYKKRRDPEKLSSLSSAEKLTPITKQFMTNEEDIVKKVKEADKTIAEAETQSLLLPQTVPEYRVRKLDPITEAKNKVLRLQEIKKAKQLKIIDSTVKSKVQKVTALPPLQDIINGDYNKKTVPQNFVHKDTNYDEIIIVSVSTNTEVTIPPIRTLPKTGQSLLTISNTKVVASSTTDLLENVSSTLQKVKSYTNSSLICSIQDVVVKKTVPGAPIGTVLDTKIIDSNNRKDSAEHGEDKIIMHLRKDRIRKQKVSVSCQTDLLPEFPSLPMPIGSSLKKHRKHRKRGRSKCSDEEGSRKRSKRKGSYSTSSSTSFSSSSSETSDSEVDKEEESSIYGGRNGSIGRGYRDRSASNERDTSKRFERRRNNNGASGNIRPSPAVEERRIVYVGRIEEETTKEELKRKFLPYGSIKQITIHYKDNGMKYGFVTYDRAQDAYQVIDSSQRDPNINIYDISFGGRRAFCKATYADLDDAYMNSYQNYQSCLTATKKPSEKEDSFEALLKQMKKKLNKS